MCHYFFQAFESAADSRGAGTEKHSQTWVTLHTVRGNRHIDHQPVWWRSLCFFFLPARNDLEEQEEKREIKRHLSRKVRRRWRRTPSGCAQMFSSWPSWKYNHGDLTATLQITVFWKDDSIICYIIPSFCVCVCVCVCERERDHLHLFSDSLRTVVPQ